MYDEKLQKSIQLRTLGIKEIGGVPIQNKTDRELKYILAAARIKVGA